MELEQALRDAYAYGCQFTDQGAVADYIPELAKEDPHRVGACAIGPDYQMVTAGEAEYKFSAQSISKIMIYLCVLENYDLDYVRRFIGVTPSSKPFNSIIELELSHHKVPVNPFINAGAIVATALLMEKYRSNTFEMIRKRAREVIGNDHLDYSHSLYLSESRSAFANRALTYMLVNDGIIRQDVNVEDLLSVYFRACSLMVNTIDLARLAAVLAHEGKASDGRTLIEKEHAATIRTVMATCGTYDYAGDFALLVGIPAKSGVGGGFVASTKSGYGFGVYCPGLDKHGNSYVGVRILQRCAQNLNLSIY